MANHNKSETETKCTYDVFLSFRGKDTRHAFTRHLYDALCRKGINTFMDNGKLQLGDQIGPTLFKAIEESKISIVVFSENYANSSWCLNELAKIHECMKSKNLLVWPVFYKVDPSDVRHQNGRYGEAMTKHESRFGKDLSEKLCNWRSALTDIANLKGEHLTSEQGRDESKFTDDLVCKIFMKLSPKDLSSNQHIVGREYLVEELKSLLDLESPNITCMLGIHGSGGIGKTTLAKALYDSIYKQYQGSTFLSNIRETSNQKGLTHLQEGLLTEILDEVSKIQLKSIEEGTRAIKSRLGLKRVLIVLDDVDIIEQLDNLAGGSDWFGLGSRIIITTRDKHLLDIIGVEKRYEVKLLNYQESLELFHQSAFWKSCPESIYEDLSNRTVRCCKGLPLALKVLGSHLVGKDLDGWKDALDRYEKSPHPGVQKVLRISYDSLHSNEKNIFLDVACFFNWHKLKYVKGILDACDFNSGDGITTLVNKSLLVVNKDDCLGMHDLLQDMGREIVKEEAHNEVGKYTRLWHHEDVLQVLANNNGSSKVQGIMLDPPQREAVNCIGNVFKKMKNLRILIVRNTSFSHEPCFLPNNLRELEWNNYPSQSLPSDFYPRKIKSIDLEECPLLVLEKPFIERFEHLTYMNISCCPMVTEFPDVSGAKNLRRLRLSGCINLVSIHKSVGHLVNLYLLSISRCIQLQNFVPTIYLPSLERLFFKSCSRLAHFPEVEGTMDKPLKIEMSKTAIKELPQSITKLTGLYYLNMNGCLGLQHLPSSLFLLPNFVTLKIGECCQVRESFRKLEGSHSMCPKLEKLNFNHADLSDEDLHAIIYNFPNLKELEVSGNNFVSLPAHIKESTKLTTLKVSNCAKLREIPELPSSVEKVNATQCNSLTAETSSMLWSQVRKEMKRLEVKMPKGEIREWFDYVNEGGYPIFKARGKFPKVALAFVFGEPIDNTKGSLFRMHLFIDGEHRRYHNFSLSIEHVLLCDLRVLFDLEEWEDAGVGNGDDWKTIEIYCDTYLTLCSWGVYVYKHETNGANSSMNHRSNGSQWTSEESDYCS